MIINKLQAQELIKYMNNQFIDRNSTKLYDGEILNQFLSQLNDWVESQSSLCNSRHESGAYICTLNNSHEGLHSMYVHGTLITQWPDKQCLK